ncbi:ArdC family protein, partial [Butyrivibrio sp.]|uniref:ArdC family protein n=1 Tax=Butyrivibrio sp. TaxID=28121 RepID=UPI0025B89217
MADENTNRAKEQLDEIMGKLEKGLTDLFSSDKYKQYLTTMAKFHNYSFNNTLLIAMQRPDATLVAGYNAWSKKFERHVVKGAKGIRIISPVTLK